MKRVTVKVCVYAQVPLPVITELCDTGMITVAVKTLQNEGLPGDSRMRIPSLLSSGTTVTDMKIRLLMFQVRIEREKYRRHVR